MQTTEFPLTDTDFDLLAKLASQDAGIEISQSKRTLLYSRLSKRLRALGMRSFAEYGELLQTSKGIEERKNFVSSLTTNVTKFYREPHHFAHLREKIIPEIRHRIRDGHTIKIWSAACSSGEEPYTVALEIAEHLNSSEMNKVKILATDIDEKILRAAMSATYDRETLSQVSKEKLDRHFDLAVDGHSYTLKKNIRDMVTFRYLNLIRPWPVKGPFDAVFCRNVVIYFSDETQIEIWGKFATVMRDAAALYIGHSERIMGSATDQFRSDGPTTYVRTETKQQLQNRAKRENSSQGPIQCR